MRAMAELCTADESGQFELSKKAEAQTVVKDRFEL
jgi:hypothetical protein